MNIRSNKAPPDLKSPKSTTSQERSDSSRSPEKKEFGIEISDWYVNLDQRSRMYLTRESYVPSKIVLSVVFTRLYDTITKDAKWSHGKLSLVDLPTNCEDCRIALNFLIRDSILHAKSTSSLHPLIIDGNFT